MTDFAAHAERIRAVPDWPEPGVTFRDITPLLADPEGLAATIDALTDVAVAWGPIDTVVGIEARGFVLAPPVALRLGAGFVPIRKAGKLPAPTESRTYDLEYGSATVEVHRDAIAPGDRVLIMDDVLATGGTIAAARELVTALGGVVVGELVLLELPALGGRERLASDTPLAALVTYR
ncbi:adenine phosphoribosyltransferase [Aeromicrobium phragmitis]|uniref:Adenine phosphoribosyltransferase n=1 Tax=Aeromicrobium phragmitis TaxID=2478914 RepID=A0A3L8PKU3_9ACTN|nr:adenine phosphoribosyltransferase [Aeromicrobium phragmitis]RLV55399.1 adenine phosphoribosyltransferase [Aeromicrobium phragmitis]